MLNPLDDLPVHQTSEPVAHPVSGDRNHYDRYFFNGYAPDATLYLAAALGVYPNRQVMDAAFSVIADGVQTSIHASRRAPADRRVLQGQREASGSRLVPRSGGSGGYHARTTCPAEVDVTFKDNPSYPRSGPTCAYGV
ncbi:MAG: hypothetical protein NVSMB16_01350 [Acidimicrobiales bacterium]